MKRTLLLVLLTFALCAAAGGAHADSSVPTTSILNRVGVTGRLGFLVPADSESSPGPSVVRTDAGFIGGGGMLFGVAKQIGVELDVTHAEVDGDVAGTSFGTFGTTTIALGAQYRFESPMARLVPFAGAGLDILVNDFTAANGLKGDVDTVVGIHLSGGVDYFLLKQVALTTEAKVVLAPDADVHVGGSRVGSYDPTGFSMTFGARYFFN